MDFCPICAWPGPFGFGFGKQREFRTYNSLLQHHNACHYGYPPPCGYYKLNPDGFDPWDGYFFECPHKNKKSGETANCKWYNLSNNTIYREYGNGWESE